jgi:putative tricarboxylic transport membrane protein
MTDDRRTAGRPANDRPSFTGPRLVGAGLLAVGLIVLIQTLEIAGARGYSPVGPTFVPTIVAIGLIALAAIFLLRTTVRPDVDLGRRAAGEERQTHWPTVGLIGGVLIVYAFALGPLGYPLATTAFLPAAARVLGSRSTLRDLVIGLALGFVVWFSFTQLLGVRLPAGPLDPVLPGSG